MKKKDTKQLLKDAALDFISDHGFESTSIRDLAKAVGIKESSYYHHFKSKQEILDNILDEFEEKAEVIFKEIMDTMPTSKEAKTVLELSSFDWLSNIYVNKYLFDPYFNKVLRVMMLEQVHDDKVLEKYNKWVFEKPAEITKATFKEMEGKSSQSQANAAHCDLVLNSYLSKLTFVYALSGKLTDDKKIKFSKDIYKVIFDITKGLFNE